MKISRECIHCLARQAVEIAEEATSDVTMQEEIIKISLKELGELNFDETAPEIAFRMHQHAKNITGINDPCPGHPSPDRALHREGQTLEASEEYVHPPADCLFNLLIRRHPAPYHRSRRT